MQKENHLKMAFTRIKQQFFVNKPITIAVFATLTTASIALLFGSRHVIALVPYYYMQFLPINALREEPLGSLFYLHSQLPLENTAFAIIVNLFRHTSANPPYVNDFWKNDSYWIGILIKQFGTLLVYNYALARTSSVLLGKRFSLVNAIGISLLPSTIMYFLFPYSALTSASLYGLIISTLICEQAKPKRIAIAAPCISALALSHNLFSYLTTFPLALALLFDLWSNRLSLKPRSFYLSLLILAIPIAWAIKNYVVFNFTSLTSWSGCALGQSVTTILPKEYKINKSIQDGWANALKNIQESATYIPTQKYESPIVLNQRMKGEGIRNWNHQSVIKSCKISNAYNISLLTRDRELRSTFIESVKQRFIYALGRVGSQFNCGGCDFSYKDLGFTWYGNIINSLYRIPLTPLVISIWHVLLWYASPTAAGILFWRQKNPRLTNVMFAVLIVNILQSSMAVSLSTIENERMLWMLDNGSMQTLFACVALVAPKTDGQSRSIKS